MITKSSSKGYTERIMTDLKKTDPKLYEQLIKQGVASK